MAPLDGREPPSPPPYSFSLVEKKGSKILVRFFRGNATTAILNGKPAIGAGTTIILNRDITSGEHNRIQAQGQSPPFCHSLYRVVTQGDNHILNLRRVCQNTACRRLRRITLNQLNRSGYRRPKKRQGLVNNGRQAKRFPS